MSACSRAASRQRTRNGSSEFWETEAEIRRDWQRCCSMRERRSTWPESPARWRKGSGARARSWRRARRAPHSIDYAKRRLVFPDDADHHALHDHVALVETQRLQVLVGGLQPDPAAGLAVKALDRGALSMDQRDHGLAGIGLVTLLNDDVVAVLDVLVDHGVPAHLQDVAATAPRKQLIGNRDRFVVADRLDRLSGGDESEQRQLRGAGLTFRRHHLDRPTLVMRAADVPFPLQIREVLVDRGERLETELAGDLLEA